MTMPPSLKSQRLDDDRRRRCRVALLSLSALVSLLPAQAQQPGTQAQLLDRVTVTGTNIRRADQETVAPVEIVTREQIERTGAQTVAEVLQKLPVTGAGAFNECACTLAAGSTAVSLRSLGQKSTLVLLNGRRTASYGFAQNVQDSFIDLSSIPQSAVERIEILKDGASAIYGSDAIAGVVNVILRREFKGIEAAGNVGFFEGKNDYRANVVAGFGDLGSDRFNVFGLLDYYKRDGLTMAETEFGRTRDFRGQQGGRNFQGIGGGTWSAGNAARAQAECPNPVDYAGLVALGLVRGTLSNLPPGTGINQPGNSFCVRDFANIWSVVPETERVGFLGRVTADFTAQVQGHAEVGLSRNKTDFIYQEPFFANTVRFYPLPPPGNLGSSPFNAIFAPGAGGNPLGVNATYMGVLNDFGPGGTDIKSDAFRLLAGLKYGTGGWNFDSAVVYSRSDVSQESRVLFTQGTIAALGIPDTLQPPTPITRNSPYNLDRPSTNSPALRASMFGTDEVNGQSELTMIDTRATTEIGNLPGGPVGVALGIEYRDESMETVPSERLQSGGVLGRASTFVEGSRTDLAMFAELALPFARQLEGQAALRYDDYSDFGTAVTPKLGLKFKATPDLLLRVNWGRGFKAPTLPEITRSTFYGAAGIVEPTTGRLSVVAVSLNGNPDLEPEKSRSFTAGFVFEPNASFSASLDVYQITWSNRVGFENIQTIANDPNDPRAYRDPVTGAVLSIATNFINVGQVSTKGVDLDMRGTTNTRYGRFGTRLAATYVDSFEMEGTEWAGTNGAWTSSNISAIPRWKGRWTVDWEQGPWTVQAAANYIHHYWRTYGLVNFPAFFAPGTAGGFPQTGQLDPKSPSYTTFDLYVRCDVTPKFAVSASVNNLTDELPPFDPSFDTTFFFDRAAGYDVRGRIFRLGAQYRF